MHRCMRCGKALEKIGEIERGCPCGSKVFLYTRKKEESGGENHLPEQAFGQQAVESSADVLTQRDMDVLEASLPKQALESMGKIEKQISVQMEENRLKNPVMLELENIQMLEKGVFNIDLKSLLNDPVVLKDTNGVYYIRLG